MDFKTLNLLFRCSKEFSHKKIRLQDLSDTECMICSYVYGHPDCSQDEVAHELKMDKTTVGKALATLESKGCIRRKKNNADKRRNCLKVTEHGYERISDLIGIHNEWLSEILDCLSKEEQKRFEEYCNRLLDRAEELIKESKNGGNNIAQ